MVALPVRGITASLTRGCVPSSCVPVASGAPATLNPDAHPHCSIRIPRHTCACECSLLHLRQGFYLKLNRLLSLCTAHHLW